MAVFIFCLSVCVCACVCVFTAEGRWGGGGQPAVRLAWGTL